MKNDKASKDHLLWFETEETAQKRIEQARSLKERACTGGLKFQAYLAPEIALWVLDKIEHNIFIDPGEAVSEYMKQAKDIDPYDDIKAEILKRILLEAEDDIRHGQIYTAEEVWQQIEDLRENATKPAVWVKISQDEREVLGVDEPSQEDIREIKKAKVPDEYSHLDELMEEDKK